MNKKKSTWQDYLPLGTAERIKKELKLDLSTRQINRIIAAGKPDKHGVFVAATRLAEGYIKAAVRLKKLTTKSK